MSDNKKKEGPRRRNPVALLLRKRRFGSRVIRDKRARLLEHWSKDGMKNEAS